LSELLGNNADITVLIMTVLSVQLARHLKLLVKLSTYLMPWSRVLEKLVVTQQVKKFPNFPGAQRL